MSTVPTLRRCYLSLCDGIKALALKPSDEERLKWLTFAGTLGPNRYSLEVQTAIQSVLPSGESAHSDSHLLAYSTGVQTALAKVMESLHPQPASDLKTRKRSLLDVERQLRKTVGAIQANAFDDSPMKQNLEPGPKPGALVAALLEGAQFEGSGKERKRSPGRRRKQNREPRPLTAKESEAVQIVGEHKGNISAAARAIGISRQALKKSYVNALEKLGKKAMPKATTKKIPSDGRGQADFSENEDRRR